jgi:hypothetical protein
VTWLASPTCSANRQIVYTDGRRVALLGLPAVLASFDRPAGWTPEELEHELSGALVDQPDLDELLQ